MSSASSTHDSLSDFSTNRRVRFLAALAVPIGVIGALVAKALLWLIAVFTNAALFLRLSSEPVELAGHHFGWWGVLVPVLGGLIIGLMARYGSEKIRGHGIPEALGEPTPDEIEVWNEFMTKRGWRDGGSEELAAAKQACGFGTREDIQTWFDLHIAEES
jgi:hypothetical protein